MPVDARLTTALAEHYTLVQELGQGGMATVYLARDVKHDREVALKVLRPELAAILGRERFLSEIRLTARLDHPHILTLLDSGESDGFVWYTLPYIRGESLRHKLDRETQLGVDEAVSITRQIAGALEHAHQHGIIHRDVKPENILLHEGEAMLADFGIALAVKEAGGKRLTETGLSLGTPGYMSPEQATAEKTLDARSDVYSLGAVLYEMLAGEPPFTGATGQAVIAKLMVEQPSSLRTVRGTIPAGLEAVVLRALSKVPADRFPSAAAFAEALAAPETYRAPRRLPRGVLLVSALTLTAIAAVTWGLPRLRPPVEEVPRGPPRVTQLTFTGTARGPALSPDGKQVAYFDKSCPEQGKCWNAVVVADLALGERRIVADSFRNLYELTWSPDQRFLLFRGTGEGKPWGQYLFSLFGNRLAYVGQFGGGRFFGGPDTIITNRTEDELPPGNMERLTAWYLLLSRDGRRLDSIPFNVPANAPYPFPSPDGRRILIWAWTSDQKQAFYLIDRHGRLTDSLPYLPGFHAHTGLQWTASGDGVLLLRPGRPGLGSSWMLLRFAVSKEGKVRLPPDTLIADLPPQGQPNIQGFALSPPSLSGDHAIAVITAPQTLVTYERPSLQAAPQQRATLISGATGGGLQGFISPDGERILVRRSVWTPEGAPATLLELWPFNGTVGTPVGPPLLGGLLWARMSADGRVIYRFGATGPHGENEFAAVDANTGRTLRALTVPDSLSKVPWLLCDSLPLYLASSYQAGTPREWRSWPDAGNRTVVFSFPDTTSHAQDEISRPDAGGQCLMAQLTNRAIFDGHFALYLARPGVPARLMSRFTADWQSVWFVYLGGPGPAFQVLANVRGRGQELFHLEPGRPPQRLGPIQAGYLTFSTDGRRGVGVMMEQARSDVWLIRWPRDSVH